MSTTVYPLSISTVASYGNPDVYNQAYNCVIHGDDLSANAGTWAQNWFGNGTVGVPAASYASTLFGTNSKFTTVATAGQTFAAMSAAAAASVDTLIVGGKTNWLMVQGGLNDVIAGTATATLEAAYVSYIAARLAAGWSKIVFIGILKSTSIPGATYTALSTWQRANVPGANVTLADIDLDPGIGAAGVVSDRQFWLSDSTTLTTNGTIRYADVAMTAAKAALGL